MKKIRVLFDPKDYKQTMGQAVASFAKLGQAAAKISSVINDAIMSEPFELAFYKSKAEIRNNSLSAALSQYKWPKDHIFVHVRPPKALDIPENYYVGESIDSVDIDTNDPAQVYWYDIKQDQVAHATIVRKGKNKHVKWVNSECLRYVVDIGNTNVPIGAFIHKEEDWTEAIDFSVVTEAQLSEALQKLESGGAQVITPPRLQKKVKKSKEKKVDYRKFLDSLPDDED